MKPPDRELSKAEYEAWKIGHHGVRAMIKRGGPKLRENHALDEKLRVRGIKAKKRAYKERRKERLAQERLRSKQFTPILGAAQ